MPEVYFGHGGFFMADFSTAAQNALDALENSSEGMVEEYEIRPNGRRVKYGRTKDLVEAIAMLQGLNRTSIFRLAKFKEPR